MLYMVYTVGGHYQAMQLFPGEYEVSVKTKGQQSDVQKLTLASGQTATVNLSMHPATAAERAGNVQELKYDEIYPPGPGKAVAEKTCVYCHGQNFLPARQWDEAKWDDAITKMTGRESEQGLMIRPNEMSPQERAVLLEYLVANFGPDSKPRAVKVEIDPPVDEANLAKAEYIEYYFNVDPPGQGVNDPQYKRPGGTEGFAAGRRMGQDPQLDKDGNVWVTDRGYPTRIVKLDPRTGVSKDYLMPEPKASLHDLNIDRYGVVWVPENEGVPETNPKLWQFDPKTEKWTQSFPFDPQKVIPDGTLKHPHSIDFDSRGNIYVSYILGGGLSVWDRETTYGNRTCPGPIDVPLFKSDIMVSRFEDRTGGWTAALVEEYLLDYFPRKVSADEDLIAKTPEILTAFFEWAEQSNHVGNRTAGAIRKRIKSIRKRFDAAARDPGNFGMAKSLFMGMQDAGVDITKQSEVDSYIKKHNTGLAAPTRSRWVWSGEGSPPDPKAPCPCGSGKRYKKCCMPR